MEALLNKIEDYGFECEGGPLDKCVHWQQLRTALTQHTSDEIGSMTTRHTYNMLRSWGEALDGEMPNGLGERLMCYADDWRKEIEDILFAYTLSTGSSTDAQAHLMTENKALRADNTALQNNVVIPLRERIKVLEGALRMVAILRQLGGVMFSSREVILSVVDDTRAALEKKT